MENNTFGRKIIYSSLKPTDDNIHKIINATMSKHRENVDEIRYLMDFFRGRQPILSRVKDVRPDINNKVVVNYAMATVRDITGYFMGTPIQYTPSSSEGTEAVQNLNKYMKYEDRPTVDKEIGDCCSICGVGYKCTLADNYGTENDVPFTITSLSPQTTYVVYGTDFGNPPILSVNTFVYLDEDDNKIIRYVAYTDSMSYEYVAQDGVEIEASDLVTKPKPHFLGMNPIVEYRNNQWLIGDFEMATTLLNAINMLASNSLDDVEQVVQSILLLFGINEEQQESLVDLANGDILMFSGEQGINQNGKYISAPLNPESVNALREYLEGSYRIIVGVPDRKTRGGGGGDTGDAVKLRDGWADIELVARTKELFWTQAEKKSIKLALGILNTKNKGLNLSPIDIDIKFSRNKNDNLQSKVTAGSTLNSMGVAKMDIIQAMDITTDVVGFEERWSKQEEEKQKLAEEMFKKQNPDGAVDTDKNVDKNKDTNKFDK